ncbi:MFSD1-like protein [Mya arenaria]|uniref:MFSD1-like protein n=1 Tax=Mya arenaria TaxID=6604 RepID=A0ABY7FQT0_MYAAR|nr:MFSD1-like protein [Mya arenaria]
MALQASDRVFRFIVLFFNCLLTFGSYFCFDMPSVLQDTFTNPVHQNCTDGNKTMNITPHCNVTCDDCLEMSPDNYNLLYAIYAWTWAFSVLLPMCVGLVHICGWGDVEGHISNVACHVAGSTNRLTAYWFRNKELALAFGITLAFSRLGSVLNFFLTQNFEATYGLNWTLWGGAMLCGLGFTSACIVSFLDIWGVKQLGDADKSDGHSLLLAVLLAAGFDNHDVVGKRGYLALGCAVVTIPVFGLLAFTNVYPLVIGDETLTKTILKLYEFMIFILRYYKFCFVTQKPLVVLIKCQGHLSLASMWPSIPLVVSQATIGTAMGLTTSIQMIGIVKQTETLHRWKFVMIFLLGNTLACVVTSLFLNINDRRKGGILNLSRREKAAAIGTINSVIASSNDASNNSSDSSDDEREPLIRKRNAIN